MKLTQILREIAYDGTVASTESDLKCMNFNILAIFGHFGQNWPTLSTTGLVLTGEKVLLVF